MSGRVRPLEVKALVPLLEQNWETPEELAEELVRTLDQVRIDRTSYIAVMQFGTETMPWYIGLGPYPGIKSARNAVSRHAGASMAYRIAVVPVTSPEKLEQRLKEAG